jgi:hypothetical protein
VIGSSFDTGDWACGYREQSTTRINCRSWSGGITAVLRPSALGRPLQDHHVDWRRLKARPTTADSHYDMTILGWVGVAAVTFTGVALVVTLAVARILGGIGRKITELLDEEAWTSAPMARGAEEPVAELTGHGLAAERRR